MAQRFTDVLAYVLWLCWTCLSTTEARLMDPAYRILIPSSAVLAQICTTAISFAPDLLNAVQSVTPPTLKFFESLPSERGMRQRGKRRWAVYLIVLRKFGSRPKIYIGSATSTDGGISDRMNDYEKKNLLPVGVERALDDGYFISHQGLLCWTDMPQPLLRIPCRALFLVLETVFSLVFWAMSSRTGDYKMPRLCPWDIVSLVYDGCCTHMPLIEGIYGVKEYLTVEQINQVEAERAERTRVAMALHQGK